MILQIRPPSLDSNDHSTRAIAPCSWRISGRFLLACLSSGFVPTVVYAADSQNLLANLYRGMGRTEHHCLGACTTGALALELITAVEPGILAMADDLPDMALEELAVQARNPICYRRSELEFNTQYYSRQWDSLFCGQWCFQSPDGRIYRNHRPGGIFMLCSPPGSEWGIFKCG